MLVPLLLALSPLLTRTHTNAQTHTQTHAAHREAHLAFILIGLFVCEGVARFLKHAFQQPRPPLACETLWACSPGLPSSHTQLMAFATTVRAGLLARFFAQKHSWSIMLGSLELVLLFLGSAAVAYSRVFLGYHTAEQVWVAAVLGCGLGSMWVWIMSSKHCDTLFTSFSSCSLGHFMNFKNTWGIADALYLESVAHKSMKKGEVR